MKKFRFIIPAIILFLISACSVQVNQTNSNTSTPKIENTNSTKIEPTKEVNTNIANTNQTLVNGTTIDKSSCYNSTKDDLMVDKKQTFPIDFKPFEGACFVTFHDPEFDDPPLGSQFYIYKNGKEVFEFPEQFGMGNTTCWADAVAFEDLNGDQLKDIAIVGKCGAKSGSYNENMVYLNTGRDFSTNADSNAEMMDFSKVSQIRDFVKKNPKMFVP